MFIKPVFIAALALMAAPVYSQTAASEPTSSKTASLKNTTLGFGSPEEVDNRLAEDKKDKAQPLKERLSASGVNVALDYSSLYHGANNVLPGSDDDAASGMLRFYGSWHLSGEGKDTGSLVWKVEHRHEYTDTAPNNFLFGAGALGLSSPPFSDQGTRVTNLYWKQKLNDGTATVTAGLLDVTDYLDVYAVASPWTGFLNFAFSTGSTTIALPNDAALGVAAGSMLGDNFFIIGGITDMESDPTDPLQTLDTFFDKRNHFKSIELGWTSSQDNIFMDNIHVTLWDADESEQLNQAADSGVNVSASKQYGQWLPFVRAGVSDKGSLLGIDKSVSAGFSYYGLGNPNHNLGVALNWADAGANDDQVTFETFYYMKVTPFLEITPDIQVIQNPALNPQEDQVVVVGLRTRLIW